MMTYAYDEMYLDDAMNNLGEAIEYSSLKCGVDPDRFMSFFIQSGYAELFGKGTPRVISGRSGTELVQDIFMDVGLMNTFPKSISMDSYSPEYWSGWSLALYQWISGRSFSNIMRRITMKELIGIYHPLHEASEDRIIETIDMMVRRKETCTYLQERRKLCGLTQRELSERSGINIRTIQQYETGAKDINKASGNTLYSLSRTLECKMEDLIQPPAVNI